MFNVGDRITSFIAVPVTQSGEPIGYPPLYVHHIHVGRLTGYYDEHWFTTHGDFSVGNDYGIGARSTAGYTTFIPDGHHFAVDCPLPYAVQAIIQDMRTVPSAPELPSVFIEVTIGLARREPATEPATLVWNEAPHGAFGYSRFAVLAEPSMSWWAMRWPASGELLPRAKLHSHYSRHHRLFVLDAAPQKLSFFASHVKSIEHLHDSVAPTSPHETMLLINLSHTEQTFSRMPSTMCQDNSSMPSYIMAATPGHPEAGAWARRRDLLCRPHTLHKGHVSTIVQLYQMVDQGDVRLFPMHTNTWFYIRTPGAASSADIKTVSYRYATHRTSSLLEPLQDEAHGSCDDKPSAAAVAKYVNDNLAGLEQAVSMVSDSPQDFISDHENAVDNAASLIGSSAGRSARVLTVAVSGVTGLVAVGLLLGVRAARARTSELV